jgi:hypothetical protein
MKSKRKVAFVIVSVSLTFVGGAAISAQDKYTVKERGGLEFSELRGHEDWRLVSASLDGDLLATILANPVMIDAYRAGIPGNGKPSPTRRGLLVGSAMAASTLDDETK